MKARTRDAAIRTCPPPATLVVPVARLPGEATRLLVRTGDRVLAGQPLALLAGGDTVCAPTSGTFAALEERLVAAPRPLRLPAAVIRADGRDEWDPGLRPVHAPLSLTGAEIRHRIGAAGIAGLGGAVFPTAAKLEPGRAIEALLVNGAECEPWITCDEILLRERAGLVIEGCRILMHALDAPQAVIAVKTDMPESRVALHDALAATRDPRISISVVTAKYPAGGERQLVEMITGREVPPGGLPRDVGIVCQNAGTVAAVADLFLNGRPLVSRIVTVTGGGIATPGNFEARLGTPVADLVAAAGGYVDDPVRLIAGGPMMGFALPDDALPVTRATNCIVAALPGELAADAPEMPCIRCGDCIQACPAGLMPHELIAAARHGDVQGLRELHLDACIECGCCDAVCPSRLPLTATFAAARRGESP